jgi:signal transduction histidine kinase
MVMRELLLKAAHDLKTPLRAVRTSAELLLKAPEKHQGPEFDEIMGFLVNGARNASAVNGDLNGRLGINPERNL